MPSVSQDAPGLTITDSLKESSLESALERLLFYLQMEPQLAVVKILVWSNCFKKITHGFLLSDVLATKA